MKLYRNLSGASALMSLAVLSQCSPAEIQSAAVLNCALAADGATVVAIARPGLALPASAGAKIGCDAGTQIGDALSAK